MRLKEFFPLLTGMLIILFISCGSVQNDEEPDLQAIHGLRGEFQIVNMFEYNPNPVLDDWWDTIDGDVKNISDSGMCVRVLGIEEKISSNLKISIPFLNNSVVEGKVIWFENGRQENEVARCGIKFNGISSAEKQQLRRAILLEETLFVPYAEEMAAKIEEPHLRQKLQNPYSKNI